MLSSRIIFLRITRSANSKCLKNMSTKVKEPKLVELHRLKSTFSELFRFEYVSNSARDYKPVENFLGGLRRISQSDLKVLAELIKSEYNQFNVAIGFVQVLKQLNSNPNCSSLQSLYSLVLTGFLNNSQEQHAMQHEDVNVASEAFHSLSDLLNFDPRKNLAKNYLKIVMGVYLNVAPALHQAPVMLQNIEELLHRLLQTNYYSFYLKMYFYFSARLDMSMSERVLTSLLQVI